MTAERRNERYRTTGEFARLDGGYVKHCGPTALTNLVLTLLGSAAPEGGEVFRRLARLGRRRMNYGNFDLGPWGGTTDLFSRGYLRAALREFGLEDAAVGPLQPLTKQRVRAALERGSILYLQLRHHPKYGSHHLLCYGLEPDGSLRLADGWEPAPTRLSISELGLGSFLEVTEGREQGSVNN